MEFVVAEIKRSIDGLEGFEVDVWLCSINNEKPWDSGLFTH